MTADPMTPTEEPTTALHAASGRSLVIVLLALLVLTLLSWAVSNLALGAASMPIALLIAAVKAGLVATWFMELPLAATPARVIVVVTISFIALLCAGTVSDVALR
jgi:cytochrome c oxidase subunit IV